MNIIEILKLLFTKIGDTESIHSLFESISKIPKGLKIFLTIVLVIGGIYFGYSKSCIYDINGLKQDVIELHSIVSNNVQAEDYGHDIYYLTEAIKMCEQINKHAYDGEQLKLDLFIQYIQKHTPNDPILYDLEAMKKRNEYSYEHWSTEFKRLIEHCKTRQIPKEKKHEHDNDK